MTSSLLTKILDLFTYREFPLLLDFQEWPNETRQDFHDSLVQLQTDIYYLDAQLESHWDLTEKKLETYWSKIYNSLQLFGVTPNQYWDYVSHIKKYQKHELELRDNNLPLRLTLEYFYFYKSCDVKLLRRLIYEKVSVLNMKSSLADWRFFDLITEINDDVEDLFEDQDTINGNRFLISLMKNGFLATITEFDNFIGYIAEANQQRFGQKKLTDVQDLIYTKTIDNIELTRNLIKTNATKFMKLKDKKIVLFDNLADKQSRG